MKRIASTSTVRHFGTHAATSAGIGTFLLAAVFIAMRGGFFTRGANAEFIRPAVAFDALDDGVIDVPTEASSIQAAADFANNGATIRIAPGTYVGAVVVDGKSLTITGAGSDVTVVRGFGRSAVLSFSGSAEQRISVTGISVVGGRGETGTGMIFDGVSFDVRDSHIAGNQGGGVTMRDGLGTFSGCKFDDNRSEKSGGAVSNEGGSPSFVACTFRHNISATFGGALYSKGGNVSILACTVEDNSTRSGAWGGAVFGENTTFELHGTDFTRNRSIESGGAVYLLGGIADVSRCTFTGNFSDEARSLFSRGAGVRIASSRLCGAEAFALGGDFAFGDGNVFDTSCFGDCNQNGVSDEEEIAMGWISDRDGNGVPDSCDPDCNSNGLPDGYEVSAGFAQDMNANGLIDICEIRSGLALDVDNDWIPDDAQMPVVAPTVTTPAATQSNTVPVPDPFDAWGPGMSSRMGGSMGGFPGQ